MQVVARVPRSGLAFIRRLFSATPLRHQNWNSVTSQWHRNSGSRALKIFQNGKSFLPFNEFIFSHKFYSTNASATVQISEKTQSASDEEESPESQALNSEKQADRLPYSNKPNKSLPKRDWNRVIKREICQVLEKDDNDMEETLTKLGFQLSRQIVIMVLNQTSSPILARRFFQWAKLQPGFTHSAATYNALTTILARSRELNSIQMVFSERLDAQVDISASTFSFATAWHDDPDLLNEVIRIIEKMPFPSRGRAYNFLIRVLCRQNANAALRVLEKMVIVGCAPNIKTFRPFIKFYRRHIQMDKVQEIYETMEIFGCPPVAFVCGGLDAKPRPCGLLTVVDDHLTILNAQIRVIRSVNYDIKQALQHLSALEQTTRLEARNSNINLSAKVDSLSAGLDSGPCSNLEAQIRAVRVIIKRIEGKVESMRNELMALKMEMLNPGGEAGSKEAAFRI